MKIKARCDSRKLRTALLGDIIIVHQFKTITQCRQQWLKYQKNLFNLQQFGQKEASTPYKIGSYPFIQLKHLLKKKHKATQIWKIFYNKVKSRPLFNLIKRRGRQYKLRCRLRQQQSVLRTKHLSNFLKLNRYKHLSGTSIITIIERRLKVAIWRRFCVITIETRRQLIRHGHIKVNGFLITNPSYILHSGDQVNLTVELIRHIALTQILAHSKFWKSLIFRSPASHLEVSLNTACFVFSYYPRFNEIRTSVPMNSIIIRSFFKYQ